MIQRVHNDGSAKNFKLLVVLIEYLSFEDHIKGT